MMVRIGMIELIEAALIGARAFGYVERGRLAIVSVGTRAMTQRSTNATCVMRGAFGTVSLS
jgi:hypothetical protein